MIDYSNPLLVSLRRIGHTLKVFRPLVLFWRRLSGYRYEDKFDAYIVSKIEQGATVWDVGANVGIFTEKFSQATGDDGKVVAFDPSPGCNTVLTDKFKFVENVQVVAKGLSNEMGEVEFSVGDELDPTGGIGMRDKHSKSVNVAVTTGDLFVQSDPDLAPNFIKLDVEGYELEVLEGLTDTLADPKLKGVFIEIHFRQLADRGLSDAPSRIVEILKQHNFILFWTDPSHLIAERDHPRPDSN